MPIDPEALVSDFAAVAAGLVPGWPCTIRTEVIPAPHRQPALPYGYGAVYLFRLSEQAIAHAPAGPGIVLKVGKAGPNTNARFLSQHYNPNSAGSTLARSLINHPSLWPWLGIEGLTEFNVKQWMLTNLDRVHFFVPAASASVLGPLEVYVRARVGSVFEGAA